MPKNQKQPLFSQQQQIMSAMLNPNIEVTNLLVDTSGLNATQSLAIYQYGYSARLLECLQSDYPALKQFLGKKLFKQFIQEYLIKHPSSSPSLFDLGAQFPEYLLQSLPDISALQENEKAFAMLPIELARMERYRVESLRSLGIEQISLENRVEPDYQDIPLLLKSNLKTPLTLNLMKSHFDLISYYPTLHKKKETEAITFPEVNNNFIAISRYSYRIHLTTLKEWQFLLLKGLQSKTYSEQASLNQLIEKIASQLSITDISLHAQLTLCLPFAKMKVLIE
jgi:hypothetical protein